MRVRWLGAVIGAAAAFGFVSPAWCQIVPPGIGGGGSTSVGALTLPISAPIQTSALTGPIPNLPNLNVNAFFPDGSTAPQRYRDLKVAGKVAAPGAKVPKDARVVRLSVNGRIIPMALDNEVASSVLEFGPNQRYAKDLYDSILTKRITVVGDQFETSRIIDAASSQKPLVIEGYVFDRMAPYMVVKSVGEPQ